MAKKPPPPAPLHRLARASASSPHEAPADVPEAAQPEGRARAHVQRRTGACTSRASAEGRKAGTRDRADGGRARDRGGHARRPRSESAADADGDEPASKPESPRVRKARETLAATETLGGSAYTEAIASDEVQAALETVSGHGTGEPDDGAILVAGVRHDTQTLEEAEPVIGGTRSDAA